MQARHHSFIRFFFWFSTKYIKYSIFRHLNNDNVWRVCVCVWNRMEFFSSIYVCYACFVFLHQRWLYWIHSSVLFFLFNSKLKQKKPNHHITFINVIYDFFQKRTKQKSINRSILID